MMFLEQDPVITITVARMCAVCSSGCISLCVMLLDLHSCVCGALHEISWAWLKWHTMGPPFTVLLCSRIGHVV